MNITMKLLILCMDLENINFHLVKYNKLKVNKNKSKKSKRSSTKSKKKTIKNKQKLFFLKSNQILGGLGNYKEYHYDDFDNMQDANILASKSKKIVYKQAKKKNNIENNLKKI